MQETLKMIVNAIEAKLGRDTRVIDISAVSSIADYFVITSGSNDRQVQAISDNIQEVLGRAGIYARSTEGYAGASWVLLDYNDVIIHVFSEEDRSFYDLERIWRDGKVVDIDTLK
ncbi:MAG: ribosome silencing factor [Lachnospiraceae bacterium]|nr:ribosome silencing factor [Lachnospiraceae bacterium]